MLPDQFQPSGMIPALLCGGDAGAQTPPTAPEVGTQSTEMRENRAQATSGTMRTTSGGRMSDASMQTCEITVARIRSPVHEGGPPGATEAVVFVRGNPGSSRDWEGLAGRVSEFGRTVALDMPGFGRADKPADFDYTVTSYARHLAGALDHLRVRRAHLVLHDFGGPRGLIWEVSQPALHMRVLPS